MQYLRVRLVSIVALAVASSIASPVQAQTANEWFRQAEALFDAGEYARSSEAYGKAIEAGAVNPTTFYNGACVAALSGLVDVAFRRLEGALDHGFRDVPLLRGDGDLKVLRADSRWTGILARCEQAEADFTAALGEPELRLELLEMRRIDQAVRWGEAIPELADMEMREVDAGNTARMKEIISEHGWPTRSLVGEDGARSAWLLVQHADADPRFQRACLDLMLAAPEGEVSPADVAYLTDRVLVNEGKPQIYGTQFWVVDGESVPRPIEDEEGLDARRARVGLGTMEEYRERMARR